jgi:hypothetical protein
MTEERPMSEYDSQAYRLETAAWTYREMTDAVRALEESDPNYADR